MIEKLLDCRKKIFIGLFLFNILSVFALLMLSDQKGYLVLGGVPLLLIHIFIIVWGFDNENEKLNLLILIIATVLILPFAAILMLLISSLFL